MLAVLLLTFGAINAALALSVETCTQGGADSLYLGFLTLLLYSAGLAAVAVRPAPPTALAALVPAAAIAVWHSLFAGRFAWNYWLHEMSACHAMLGEFPLAEAGEWMDGGEPMLTALWLAIGLLFWTAFILVLRRGRQSPPGPESHT
ncbi:MAG TPA: hypothetical protein VGB04_06370 [Allosphingosinicella sp.]|jgi:hypothetical protein